MKLKWQYWFFKNALSHQFCDDIIKFCSKKKTELGTISGIQNKKKTEKNLAKLLKHRNSNVSWIAEPWMYHEMHNLIHRANESAEWNYHWNLLSILFTKKDSFTIGIKILLMHQ